MIPPFLDHYNHDIGLNLTMQHSSPLPLGLAVIIPRSTITTLESVLSGAGTQVVEIKGNVPSMLKN